MKYFIIILSVILLLLFLLLFNIKVRIYKRNNEKYNIDLILIFFFKITIDIDEKFKNYLNNKKQIEIFKDIKTTISNIILNNNEIKQILSKIIIDKIILISQIVPSDPITYSYIQFINYQFLNYIKNLTTSLFKKIKKEDYQVILLDNNISKKWYELITFDLVFSFKLITLIMIIIKHFKFFKKILKGNKYGTTSY